MTEKGDMHGKRQFLELSRVHDLSEVKHCSFKISKSALMQPHISFYIFRLTVTLALQADEEIYNKTCYMIST